MIGTLAARAARTRERGAQPQRVVRLPPWLATRRSPATRRAGGRRSARPTRSPGAAIPRSAGSWQQSSWGFWSSSSSAPCCCRWAPSPRCSSSCWGVGRAARHQLRLRPSRRAGGVLRDRRADRRRGGSAGLHARYLVHHPAVAVTKNEDLIHMVIGRPGVILVGEGAPSRIKHLMANQRKKTERWVPDTPSQRFTSGTATARCRCPSCSAPWARCPRCCDRRR